MEAVAITAAAAPHRAFQISDVDLGGTKYTFWETSDDMNSESDMASASVAASEAIVTD